ncbi:MAG: formate dehydrogenase accessory sulfurtransferase FdhD, partial [Pseudomonadota bacterium]
SEFLIAPDPHDPALTRPVTGRDHDGREVQIRVVEERPLTIYLNRQEIVTAMTIGDHPEHLAVGYLLNQNMLQRDDVVTAVEYDDDLEVVVVRTERETDYEAKLQKKVRTSGCAVGTVYGDVMEAIDQIVLPKAADGSQVRASWLYALAKKINTQPSLYLEAGAIHGCVLCREDQPLVYMEDVGRHNAVDKIAGWMFASGENADDKLFYTTGRLTSEMVMKTAMMGVPVLASRSGFTASGVEIARQVGLTLIGRMRGKRFVCLAGEDRLIYDADPSAVEDERPEHGRKGSRGD